MSGPVETDGSGQTAPQGSGTGTGTGTGTDPSPAHPPIDRAAALAEGAPGIPARFVWWVLGGALVLSLGGLLGEHLFSSAGLNPSPTTTTTAPSPTRTAPADTPAPPGSARSLDAALPSFMGLTTLSPRQVAPFTLTDQQGQPLAVPSTPPRVVVLTFFDAPCNDICPVLASEIEQADTDLGARASEVEFVTVNTDPAALAVSAGGPALGSTGLGSLANWHLVTGPLASLNPVWKAYGVSISLNPRTGLEAHTDVMDFVDAQGFLRYRASPFADEGTNGDYTLSTAAEARWGEGIAAYAGRLIGQ
ncbi:MAG TPA: SCO family protein [Acidimicrobiales bacterium]|nr:SCO family protein [Acidimicrobiales bacterium]